MTTKMQRPRMGEQWESGLILFTERFQKNQGKILFQGHWLKTDCRHSSHAGHTGLRVGRGRRTPSCQGMEGSSCPGYCQWLFEQKENFSVSTLFQANLQSWRLCTEERKRIASLSLLPLKWQTVCCGSFGCSLLGSSKLQAVPLLAEAKQEKPLARWV